MHVQLAVSLLQYMWRNKTKASKRVYCMPSRKRTAQFPIALCGVRLRAIAFRCTVIFSLSLSRRKGQESVAEPRVELRLESGEKARRQKCIVVWDQSRTRTDERIQLVRDRRVLSIPGPKQTGNREAIGKFSAFGKLAVVDRLLPSLQTNGYRWLKLVTRRAFGSPPCARRRTARKKPRSSSLM